MSNKPTKIDRGNKPTPAISPKEHGHQTLATLFREIRQDEAARKEENELGQILRGLAGPTSQQATKNLDQQENSGIER